MTLLECYDSNYRLLPFKVKNIYNDVLEIKVYYPDTVYSFRGEFVGEGKEQLCTETSAGWTLVTSADANVISKYKKPQPLQECCDEAKALGYNEVVVDTDAGYSYIIHDAIGTDAMLSSGRVDSLIDSTWYYLLHPCSFAATTTAPVDDKPCTCTYNISGPSLDNTCAYHNGENK